MPRTKRRRRRGGSLSAYFRGVYEERPDWLDSKSNELVLERFKQDHGGKEGNARVRANLANIKSTLRKLEREGGNSRTGHGLTAAAPSRAGGKSLEALEVHIDDALTMAKNLGLGELESVIQHLRHARNEVVWKLG